MKPYEVLTVGGREVQLKFTAANAVRLEEQIGTDLLSGLDKLAEVKTLAKFYLFAAKSMNDDINKIDDIYSIFDEYITDGGSYEALQELIIETLVVSGIMSRQVHEASKKAQEKQREALQKLLNGDTKTPSQQASDLPSSGQ